MALARTYAMALAGVQGHVVEIEADIENGLVALLLVGLSDTALREAKDRIRSAIINSSQFWPQRRIAVGLSPASLPKREVASTWRSRWRFCRRTECCRRMAWSGPCSWASLIWTAG